MNELGTQLAMMQEIQKVNSHWGLRGCGVRGDRMMEILGTSNK